MKFPNWKPASSVAAPQEDFAGKLGALRIATGRADRFVSLCACAVHDKPFTVVYERTDPAKPFTIAGIYKDEEASAGTGKGAARSRSLPASEIDICGWRCPHCAAADLNIACQKCHTTVCGGRTRSYPGTAEVFQCRDSCGSRGILGDLKTVTGVDPAQPGKAARAQVPVGLSSPDRPALPGPANPRLRGK